MFPMELPVLSASQPCESSPHLTVSIDLRVRFYEGSVGALNRVSFSVPKREIETLTGLSLDIGKTYRIRGAVMDSWRFDVERTISHDRYVDIYVPTRSQKFFKRDQEYRVNISSIELISTSSDSPGKLLPNFSPGLGSIWSRDFGAQAPLHLLSAQQQRDGKAISFALNKSWLEKRTKIHFEPGRSYRIFGTIGGLASFDRVLHERGYGEVCHVSVARRDAAHFGSGERFDVQVDSVEEVRTTEEPNREIDEFWEWRTVAAWTDTEGQYQSGKSRFRAVISQDEPEPLEGIRSFLLREDIPSVVYNMGNGHYQLRTLGGMESLAKFVLSTEPFIRTQNKMEQIERFKEMIRSHQKYENVHKRNARRILGL